MNNKLNHNFSMRKLLLSALVAGPLAVLPAPLWALPDTAATNLVTSSSVTLSGVLNGGAGALNVNASANNQILNWVSFNVTAADTINYILPSTTSSILNNVTGGSSTIAGALNSNGNVYLLNPAGIVISKTANINVGGFYASTVSEPSSFFSTTGTLNFTGSANADVTLQSDGAAAPSIQAVGTGNAITLAGRSVLVEGANLYGNVRLQSSAAGAIRLAQTSAAAQDGGDVNIRQANGQGGNLTIVSNGAAVSLSGTPVAVTPAITVNANGTLSVANPIAPVGSGYAPSSSIPVTFTAPQIRQSLSSATTASTTVGTTASGFATTDANGRITGYTLTNTAGAAALTNSGSGYIATTTGGTAAPQLTGRDLTATVAQQGFRTSVAGNATIDTTGAATNGAVTQSFGRFTVTGGTTITTGSTTAADVTLSNANLNTLTMPVVGNVNVREADGLTLGNSKVLPTATGDALTLATTAGNIAMNGTAKVEVVPSVTSPDPTISLSADAGNITYSGTGSLKFSTLATTTTSGAIATVTATGNITTTGAPGVNGLTMTTTGGDITTGALSTTAGAARQVIPTLTASGNVTVNGNINTTGKVVISAGGAILINGSNTALMTTGAGLDLKAVGDIGFLSTNPNAGIATSSTDAKIESTAGSVTIPGGFSGAGTITAAQNIAIGTSTGARSKPSVGVTTALDMTPTTFKVTAGTVSSGGGLYAPSSQVALDFTGTTAGTIPAAFASTNASGVITGITITEPGAAITQSAALAANITLAIAAPTNAIVAGGALTLNAKAGTVTVGGPIVGAGNVTVTSAGSLTVPSITAPTVSLTSTAGAIAQTAATSIIASGTSTLNAATSVTLDNLTNDFGSLVVLNSPTGASVKDANAVLVANGTDAKGSLTISSGNGLTTVAPALTNIVSPNVAATASAATVSAGSVTAVTLTTAGTGYTPNTQPAVTFQSPPTATLAGATLVGVASTAQTVSGWRLGAVGTETNALQAVVLASPVGFGYVNGSEIPLTVAGTATTLPTAVGVVNANGQIASVKVLTPGVNVTAITGITINTAAPIAGVAATGYLNINALGQATGIVVTDGGSGYLGAFAPRVTLPAAPASTVAQFTPTYNLGGQITGATVNTAGTGYATAPTIAAAGGLPAFTTTLNATNGIATVTPVTTGGIALGAATTDVIKVAGALSLSASASSAYVGSITPVVGAATSFSEITTVANTVNVFGGVAANTNGANATIGVANQFATPSLRFGQVSGSVAGGTLTVIEQTTLNLGAITAGSLSATSTGGDIVNSGKLNIAGTSSYSANSIFNPGTITLNDATNVFGGAVTIVNGKNVAVSATGALTLTAGSAVLNGVVSGSLSGTTTGNLNVGVAGNGNLTTVGFSSAGNVVINDGTNTDGLTIQNASNIGTGTVGVTATGPITLGSGIALASTGTATFTSTGSTATIKDSAPGISILGQVALNSGNDIAISQVGHSLGRVALSSGTNGAGAGATTSSNIVYTEGGTANLGAVSIGGIPGSLTVVSTGGSIIQTAGAIAVPTATGSTNTVTLSAPNGSVTLDSAGNTFAVPVSLTAAGNSSLTQTTAQSLVLGNVAVTAGGFAAKVTTAPVGAVTTDLSQATGTTARIFGATTLTSNGGKITLANTGNNFGGLTIDSTNAGATAVGAAVAITEGGTLNLLNVNTGTAATSTLALTSEGGSVVQTATPLFVRGITVGGNTTISSKGDVAFNKTDIDNNFGGKTITVTAPGNVSIQDKNATTIIAGGSTINGTLTVKNTHAAGTIKDSTGNLQVDGNVFLETSTTGTINITASNAAFGALQFRSGAVTIYEGTTMTLAAGSTAAGATFLTSGADIVTSGTGGANFTSSLSLNANGRIIITNPFFVGGGLTVRALTSIDLKSLSTTGNLAGIAVTNLTPGVAYAPPAP